MAVRKIPSSKKNTPQQDTHIGKEGEHQELAFRKKNYQLLLISMAIVVIGFILMIGTTDIYDFRKTVIAPLVVLAGFTFGFYAILKK